MTNIDQPTAEDINNNFKAAGDSVDLINGIVAGTKMINEDPEDTVKRNEMSRNFFPNDGTQMSDSAREGLKEQIVLLRKFIEGVF